MKRLILTAWLAALLSGSSLALAQTQAETEADGESAEELPQYYQVELVVFRHLDQSRTTPEIPRTPEPELTELLEQDLARLGSQSASDNAVTAEVATQENGESASLDELSDEALTEELLEAEPRWVAVAEDGLLLTDTVQRIDNIQAYELVAYLSWGQTAEDVTVAEPLDLTEIAGDQELLLTGNVELHQRRYLHLTIDLELTDEGIPAGEDLQMQAELPMFDIGTAMPAIKDSRRIRLEKPQYFDQPQFGVVAVVSRLELPADTEELTEELQEDAAAEAVPQARAVTR